MGLKGSWLVFAVAGWSCRGDAAAGKTPDVEPASTVRDVGANSAAPESRASAKPKGPEPLPACPSTSIRTHPGLDAVCASLQDGDEAIACTRESLLDSITDAASAGLRGAWIVCQSDVPASECAVAVEASGGTLAFPVGVLRSSMGTEIEEGDVIAPRVLDADNALGSSLLRFSVQLRVAPKSARIPMDSEDGAEALETTVEWLCTLAQPATCWEWITAHSRTEISVQDDPKAESVRVTHKEVERWRRELQLDLRTGAARVDVVGDVLGLADAPSARCQLVVGVPRPH